MQILARAQAGRFRKTAKSAPRGFRGVDDQRRDGYFQASAGDRAISLPPDGPLPNPAWRRLQPDARQPEVATRRGERSGAPPVVATPVGPLRPNLPALPAPPQCRGGARSLGRQDRHASGASPLRCMGAAASRSAQPVARGGERLRVSHAAACPVSPGVAAVCAVVRSDEVGRYSFGAAGTCACNRANPHLPTHLFLTRLLHGSSIWTEGT